ncbi:GMC family oxidoreductase [Pseudonocardia sp. NPDC049635]|uniref:GMC family oxidoreductase n=1 Tax=Pseudonocardia sp. NPDC049635 TaxID=3155506 RepID=UPI0033C7F66E
MSDTHAPAEENVDIIIVGAGAAGTAMAAAVAGRGLNVLCLEQGGWIDQTLRERSVQDHEILGTADLSPVSEVRRAPADYPIDSTESDMTPLTWNGVGGSVAMWAGAAPRLHPSDFAVRTLDGVAEDWPITYEELEPYYEQAESLLRVAGLDGNPSYPPRRVGFPEPPLPVRTIGARVAAAHDELGWHWWPGSSALHGRAFDGIHNCHVHATCPNSCPERQAKQAGYVSWQRSLSGGVQLRTGIRITRVVAQNGEVSGVEYLDRGGTLRPVRARRVVLAAGGLGTPRLLLMSATPEAPAGLANSSGLVGKGLMMHPFAVVTGYFAENMDSQQTNYENAITCQQWYETDKTRGFVRGAHWALCSTGGPVQTAVTGGVWGPEHRADFGGRFSRGALWGIFTDDLPDDDNTVTLSERTDAAGLPGVKVTYRIPENSMRILEFNVERAEESLRAAGAVEVRSYSPARAAGWHLMGTARMGSDPTKSVVNSKGETHDVAGLYICDASAFTTGGAVNPALTVTALAFKAADHLLKTLEPN